MRPDTLFTRPAIAVGMAPANSTPMYVHLGPKRSQRGPATNRTTRVPVNAAMLEFATSACCRLRSTLIVRVSSGGKAYLYCSSVLSSHSDTRRIAYHDQNAMKKPHQEKKNTLPYWLMGFSTGIDLAFLLMGLMVGAVQSTEGENMAGRWSSELFVQVTQADRSCSQRRIPTSSSRFVLGLYRCTFLSSHLAECHVQKQWFTEMLKSTNSQGIWAF